MLSSYSSIIVLYLCQEKIHISFFGACFLILYFHACVCIHVYVTYMNNLVFKLRNLRALSFKPSDDQLTIGKDLEVWLEEIEREFRYFKLTSPLDKKDAIIIYKGQQIARLARSLPDPEDHKGEFDEYKKLRTKLNDYFISKRNRHYARYLFLKLRPEREESTVAYATRLREKTWDSNFGVNCN